MTWTVRECANGHIVSGLDSYCHCRSPLLESFDVVRVELEGAGQARRTDPPTAKAAGDIKVRRGSQRWKTLEAIRASGGTGATAYEVECATGIPYASLTPRIGELKRGGYIRATTETRPSRYGVDQEVLVCAGAVVVEEEAVEDGAWEEHPEEQLDLLWE